MFWLKTLTITMSSSTYSIGQLSVVVLLFYLQGTQPQGANEAIVFKVLEKHVLDVRYGGKWGQICGKEGDFDTKIAVAICQQMDMELESSQGVKVANVPSSQISINKVKCTDTSIDSCSFTPGTECPVNYGLALSITLSCHHITDVHLVNGSDPHSGLVEIVRGAERGVVCYDSTTSGNVANIACKQMGYSGGTATDISKNGSYTGKSFDVTCASGSEANLDGCTISEAGSACNSILQVQCTLTSASQITFDVRLSQSSKPIAGATSGTVEVFQYGKWGVICDTGWSISAANVVCRQLGFTGAVPTTGFPTKAKFGQGTGRVFWNNVQCSGDKPSIAECEHDEVFGTSACNSVNASGVICSSETLPTFDICSNETITIPAGVSFLRSPGYPKPFNYTAGTTCSWTPRNLAAATNLTLYIHQKMFQQNHVESLTFDDGISQIQLYGDDSSAGPFNFTDTDNFTIQFESDTSAGEGMLNIQIKATMIVPSTTRAPTTAGNYGTNSLPASPTGGGPPYDPGMIVGIVVAVIALIVIAVVIIVLWKKDKIPQKRKRVGSIDKGIDESKREQQGGFDNDTFQGEGFEIKEKDLKSAGGRTGYYNIQQGGKTGRALEAQPKSKPNSESKEPETGETKRNGGTGRPASGSDVKVVIENPAYSPELEEPQSSGSPYELEGQPQSSGSPYELEGPAKASVKPWVVESSAPADNANDQYAVVNKVKRGQKGPAFVTPNETTNPGVEPPPYVYANNLKQDIDNGNINDDFVQPADDYEEVRKPQTFVPGQSAAYADIELGAGGAPSIQEQEPPVPENKLKKDKKKKREKEKDKEGDKKEAKKGEKKRRKKGDNKENKNEDNEADQKEDRKKSKKKGKKGDKTDGKKNTGSSDDISGPIPEGDSCADPMSGDFNTYAEVGKETGRIEPVGGSQPDDSENAYDVCIRKGPNCRPGPSDPTYGVPNFQA